MNLNHGQTKYRSEYCDMLIDHMAQGYAMESFGAIIKVGRSTLYQWVKEIPEFREAKEIGDAMGLKYFETAIKSASMSRSIDDKVIKEKFDPKKINVPTMQWFIKNRFNHAYAERNITVIEGGEKPVEIKQTYDLSKFTVDELKELQKLKSKMNVSN